MDLHELGIVDWCVLIRPVFPSAAPKHFPPVALNGIGAEDYVAFP